MGVENLELPRRGRPSLPPSCSSRRSLSLSLSFFLSRHAPRLSLSVAISLSPFKSLSFLPFALFVPPISPSSSLSRSFTLFEYALQLSFSVGSKSLSPSRVSVTPSIPAPAYRLKGAHAFPPIRPPSSSTPTDTPDQQGRLLPSTSRFSRWLGQARLDLTGRNALLTFFFFYDSTIPTPFFLHPSLSFSFSFSFAKYLFTRDETRQRK